MATTDFVWGRIPVTGADVTIKNTDGTNNFVAGNLVTLDPANAMATGTPAQPAPGCVLAVNNDYTFGVVIESIAIGAFGRVQRIGQIQVVASAAITAGAIVQSSGSGKVATSGVAQPQVGQALTAAAGNLDLIWVALDRAKNS